MRKAMAEAEVGDEQRREDPTVLRLEEIAAARVGQESSVFLPSASMGNEIAYKVHTRPGDEIILDRWAHPANFEGGGPAALCGASIRPLDTPRGIFTPEQVEQAIRPDDPHFSRTRLVSVEQTTNVGGGTVWKLEEMQAVLAVARKHLLRAHLDGARLFNAQAASGIPADRFGTMFDSVTVCFTKGLGAPVGAIVAGTEDFCREARRLKHLFGGAMRQAGFLAAACLYALEHNVERMVEDHENARELARGLKEIEGIRLDPDDVQSNMVYLRVDGLGLSPAEFSERLLQHGVRINPYPVGRLRAVTHLDVSKDGIKKTIEAARSVAAEALGATAKSTK
jgi:threonine aldolase